MSPFRVDPSTKGSRQFPSLLTALVIIFNAVVAHRSSLEHLWGNHSTGPMLDKWIEYASVYQGLFESYNIGGEVKMLEIGVQSGGSLVTWSQWFQDAKFTYVGIDINPLCRILDESSADSIYIEIGSQEDDAFLIDACSKYGPFDIIIDDGGHTAKQMIGSLRTLYPCVKQGGFYVIEDVMCGTWSNTENIYFEGKSVFQHIARIHESMHAHFADMFPNHHKDVYDPIFSNQIKHIHLLDSLAVFEKGTKPPPPDCWLGTREWLTVKRFRKWSP